MKKTLILNMIFLFTCMNIIAQDNQSENSIDVWKYKNHVTFGISSQTLTETGSNSKLDSKNALSLQFGKTIWLHPEPIANMVRIGLDVNYVELHYAFYKETYATSIYKYYQGEFGIGVGPSVYVAPFYNTGKEWAHIRANTYFHITPSASAIYSDGDDESDGSVSYNTFWNWGIGVNYRNFGIGFETRWGKAKYKRYALSGTDPSQDKVTFKTTTSKFTLSFRF